MVSRHLGVRISRANVESRRLAEAAVHDLGIATGTTWSTVIARIEERYRKPIVVAAADDDELADLSGLWIDYPTHGYIAYRAGDAPYYQWHSFAHELGHVALDHDSCAVLEALDFEAVKRWGLGSDVRRMRARGLLDTPDEQAAEHFASALVRRMLQQHIGPEEMIFG
ncbi:hypothetical protein ACPPVW_18720 [Leifsonia sp. McL0607]|uniref:hypothetical protein n=1 Tax=Leifsonia sp. McL0607 TaxID=3415672 RepID=UPI003CF3D1BA